MKKTLLLTLLLVWIGLSDMRGQSEYFEYEGVRYTIISEENKTVSTRYGSRVSGDVVLPSQVQYNGNTYTLVEIASSSFLQADNLESIIIPNSVCFIYEDAFKWCTRLKRVTIGNSVTSIGENAFSGCIALRSLTFNDGNSSIELGYEKYDAYGGKGLFVDCPLETLYLGRDYTVKNYSSSYPSDSYPGRYGYSPFANIKTLTEVTIGDNVTSLPSYFLYNCSGLKSVTIPNSVTEIGNSAFENCSSLTSVTIPNSVTEIGSDAFSNCGSLRRVDISDLIAWCNINFGNGVANPLYYAKHLYSDNYEITDLTIPVGVTSIKNYAFYNCSDLKSATIPNSVTTIGNNAFSGCIALRSLTFNDGDSSIELGYEKYDTYGDGKGLFVDCPLETLYLGRDYTVKNYSSSYPSDSYPRSYGYSPFANIKTLTEVTIGNKVTSLPEYLLYNCSNLTSVTIGNSLTSVRNYAFTGCNIETLNMDCYSIKDWFGGLKTLKTLTIGNSVTSIGNYAFSGCSGLTSVTIGNSVTTIGDYAFRNCSGLTSIELPNSVTEIRRFAFSGCSSLTGMTIPNAVTVIEESAFDGCRGLTSVIIPNSVTSIEIYAFNGCSSLNSLTFEDGETRIKLGYNAYSDSSQTNGKGLFADCSLKTLYLGRDYTIKDYSQSYPSDSYPSRYGYSPFANIKTLAEVTIGDNVTSLPGYFLLGCSGLTNVTISNSVTSIGDCAFSGCSSLRSLTFEDSDSSIELGYETYSSYDTGEGLFVDCPLETLYLGRDYKVRNYSSSYPSDSYPSRYGYSPFANIKTLTEVTIGDNVTSLPSYFLLGCSGLTNVEIPHAVTSINTSAFRNCSGLTKVVIPNSVTSISTSAFQNCTSLTKVVIPNSVTSIGQYVFNGCSSLSSITFEEGESLVELGYNTYNYNGEGKGLFADCPLENIYIGRNLSYTSLSSYGYSPFANITTLIEIRFGDKFTSWPGYLFYGCSSLTSVTIPNSVTEIGNSAFENCSSLTSVTIPNSVTEIGSDAFSNCGSLRRVDISDLIAWCNINFGNEVANPLSSAKHLYLNEREITDLVIPNSITSIRNYAFYGCSGMTGIEIHNSVTEVGNNAFSGCSFEEIELLNPTPPSFYNEFGNYVNNAVLLIPDNTLSAYLATDWRNFMKIEEENGDKAYIGNDNVFKYRFIENLKEAILVQDNSYYTRNNISIPDRVVCDLYGNETFYQVTSIGPSAFSNCAGITQVKLPSNLVSIEDNAFSGCIELTNIEIPNLVTSIGDSVFSGCIGLKNIELPNTVTSLGESAFKGCTALTSVNLGNAISLIGNSTFSDCSSLTGIEIPNSVTSIGSRAFYGCEALASVSLSNSIVSMGEGAFEDCISLTSLEIPNYVTSIEQNTFTNCSSLKSIKLPTSLTSIGANAFEGCIGLESIELVNSLKTIGDASFLGCSSLKSIELPNSITTVGDKAFYECSGITEISIPESLTYLGKNAFFTGENLRTVRYNAVDCEFNNQENGSFYYTFYRTINNLEIGKNVKTIPSYFAPKNEDIKEIIIPNSVTTIGEAAFRDCIGMINLEIGSSVKNIGKYAFNGCSGLRNLIISDNMEGLTFDGGESFSVSNLYLGRNLTNTCSFPNVKTLTTSGFVTQIPSNAFSQSPLISVIINPGAQIVIEAGAFRGCSYLTELVLPEDVAEIGANAFSGTGLKNVIVPGGIIGDNAFANCNLNNIILGANVESIGEKAFDGSNSIKNVYATPTAPPAAQNNTFSYYEAQLWVPEEAIDTYYNFTRCWYRFNGKPLVCPENLTVAGPASFSGIPGETLQLSATIAPSNVTLDRVLWRSTNPAFATVDNNGLVTIHNFQSSDGATARAAEEGFCQIIASTLYEESPVAVVNIEALTTSIEYINSEDMSSGSSATFGQNDIYTLQGVCLKRNASQNDINALSPGIYIIGGKKVIVK